ncbi:MAG: hypothetical protein LQ340_001166 [Diploschistes diacapsis]|nr:MAG: hypothetical protein LQ340_001166 [Diploschistes diacapsis]
MASIEQMMPDYPMMENTDDLMEDLADVERQQDLAVEDIDIDLESNQGIQHDEQMAEIDFDLDDYEPEIVQTSLDKDDEMADEEQQDMLGDHEIQDEFPKLGSLHAQNTSTEVRMADRATPQPFYNGKSGFQEDDIDFDVEEEINYEELLTVPKVREDRNTGSTQHIGEVKTAPLEEHFSKLTNPDNNHEPFTQNDKGEPEEIENLSVAPINSEDGVDLAGLDQVQTAGLDASNAIEQTSKLQELFEEDSVAISETQGENREEVQSFNTDASLPTEDRLAGKGNLLQVTEITALQPKERFADADAEQMGLKGLIQTADDADNRASSNLAGALPEYRDQEQLHVPDDSIDDIYPMIVEFNGQELSLFIPSADDVSEMFLLSDHSLIEQDVQALLHECRSVLSTDLSLDEDLILGFPALGLEISENDGAATTTSLAQLRDTFISLNHNDGIEETGPLYLQLTTKFKVTAQLSRLRVMIEEGKGLKDLKNEDEIFDRNGDSEETSIPDASSCREVLGVQDVLTAETDDTRNQPQQKMTQNEREKGGPQRGKTPLPDDIEDENELIDFGSPRHKSKQNPLDVSKGMRNQETRSHGISEVRSIEAPGTNKPPAEGEPGIQAEKPLVNSNSELANLLPNDDDTFAGAHFQGDMKPYDGPDINIGNSKDANDLAATDTETIQNELSGASSTLQEDEIDFPPDNPEDSEDKTDNGSLSKLRTNGLDEATGPEENDLGFDFDDCAGINDTVTKMEPDAAVVERFNEGLNSFPNPEPSKYVISETSINAQSAARPYKTKDLDHIDFDEIDFPTDDEDTEPNVQPLAPALGLENAESGGEKFESLKRSRPYDEDANVVNASPNGLKRQRSN